MKAWRLEEIGKIELTEVPKPSIKNDEVLVEVRAAGICGSDIPRVYENGAHNMPLTIGHEFSGVVVETGAKVADCWKNKRVGIFPLIPCKKCGPCKDRHYEMCEHYSYLGSRQDGGFAEYVAVPEWNLIELPDQVTYQQAAMLEPMAVAVHAMRQLNLTADMSVAVCGLGTIGQLLIMFLLQRDIKQIYAIGNKDYQKDTLVKMGLPEDHIYIGTSASRWIAEQTQGHGIDAFYECVGRNEIMSMGVEAASSSGQICLVGNPYTDMGLKRDIYWKILRKQLTVKGTWNSSFLGNQCIEDLHNIQNKESKKCDVHNELPADDWQYVMHCLENGSIHPELLITHKLAMEELEQGLRIMRDKSEPYTKVMMLM